MLVFVRAGSIVPNGAEQQYIGEKPDAPVTLSVFAGADGRFTLYEDDGRTYGYERGEFSRIPITWNEASKTLTIGARIGRYPGMPASRTFNAILTTPSAGAGQTITYTGAAVTTRLR
jgi:alpha-D-xyloside xylohydrolase